MNITTMAHGNVMVEGETLQQQLARAKGYPYARPDTSFLFIGGEVFPFDNAQWRGLDRLHEITGRCGATSAAFAAARGVQLAPLAAEPLYTPVLAIGSNAGPEQLRRKYPAAAFPGCVVPVIQVALEDFDVVYTPYISSYGSCTATLEHSPGTTARIFITYLTEPLMERMHATEGGYNLCRLSSLRLHVAPTAAPSATSVGADPRVVATPLHPPAPQAAEGFAAAGPGPGPLVPAAAPHDVACHSTVDWVYQYNHRHGCIRLPLHGGQDSPVAIADIPAAGRRYPAASQPQMLGALMAAAAAAAGAGGSAGGEGPAAQPLLPVALPGHGGAPAGALEGMALCAAELDAWILNNIACATSRAALCERLVLHAAAFSYPHAEVVLDLGR